jgi:hypothetical protein
VRILAAARSGIGRDAFQRLDDVDGDGRYVAMDVTRDSMI